MLSPSGVLVVAVPNARSPQARVFGANWLHLDVPRHLWHFSGRSLEGAFERHGLAPAARWNHELEYDLFGWAQSALNVVLSPANEFFRQLTGKPARVRRVASACHAVLGFLALVLAVPATIIERMISGGATLVIGGRR